ncbi:cytochrome c biogenesis CcdA family protein [Streptomyces sp. MAR4 CNX-425]|uniref:cytochrome c biogenesis CcdA family protein n=1 Tax=Streptomyces sp. MAR4 CNX-425 TaxID=3406343 RepID=UPI003B502D27
MTADIGYLTAFLGGLLALLSPCSALLLPSFFAYSVSGAGRLLARTGIFYAGLCTTLVPLGVAGSFASRLFYGHRELLIAVGGWTIVALGVAQMFGFGFGSRRMQQAAGRIRPESALSVYALGAVYGFAGFCAGPILGSVLTVSALGGDSVYGGALLAFYALGMAAPLFVLALLWHRFDLGGRRWLRGRPVRVGRLELHSTQLLSGALFVVLGTVFLAFDGTSALPGAVSVDEEFALEQWTRDIGSTVPDAVLMSAVAVGVLGAVAVGRRRSRAGRNSPDA